MVISRNAPFSAGYTRIFSALSFVLSVGSTTLLAIISVYAWLDGSRLQIPFVIAAAFNIVGTALILLFSLWRFSKLVTLLGGVLPSFFIAFGTGGLWSVSVIQFRWLPQVVVARDTRWILTATIGFWVFTLAVQVVFWTLLVALRCRPNASKEDEDPLGREISQPKPPASHLAQGSKAPREMIETRNSESGRNRPRPLARPIKALIFPRGSPTTAAQRSPLSPRRRLEPSPFTQSSFNLPTNSPFLNLLNRPKPRTAPSTPQTPAFPLPITEQEASNLAAFDEWDTSSLSMRDRIMYSIAAAEQAEDPGAPPHTLTSDTETSLSGIAISVSRRSSSAPTPPPRTPPQKLRTSSLGSPSNNSSQHSVHIVSPIPQSPSPSLTGPQIKSFGSHTSQLRTLGIPLCDSPERERSNRVTSPLQVSITLRDFETGNQESERSGSPGSSGMNSSNSTNRSPDDDAAWQAHWAATLERKVTPPMPGFEVGPRESMRRMREEISMRTRQDQQQPRGSESPSTISSMQAFRTHSRNQRSPPTTPTAAPAPPVTPVAGEQMATGSRALEGINEMIDELRDHLGVPPSNSNSGSDTTSPTTTYRF